MPFKSTNSVFGRPLALSIHEYKGTEGEAVHLGPELSTVAVATEEKVFKGKAYEWGKRDICNSTFQVGDDQSSRDVIRTVLSDFDGRTADCPDQYTKRQVSSALEAILQSDVESRPNYDFRTLCSVIEVQDGSLQARVANTEDETTRGAHRSTIAFEIAGEYGAWRQQVYSHRLRRLTKDDGIYGLLTVRDGDSEQRYGIHLRPLTQVDSALRSKESSRSTTDPTKDGDTLMTGGV